MDYSSHPSYRSGKKGDDTEPSGILISVEFEPVPFYSYEIYNFIEDYVKVELEDLSLFRDLNGTPTGTVIAQFTEEVTQSRLERLQSQLFKGKAVKVRLFQSVGAFHKFIRMMSISRLDAINFDNKQSPPIIYVLNFNGDNSDVNEFFGQCGQISMVKSYKYRNTFYYVIFFTTETAAMTAYRTFNGHRRSGVPIIVAPLYKGAAERTFAVHNCNDFQWLKQEVSYFGGIDSIKQSSDGSGDIFFQMDSLEFSKAACVLLNNREHGGRTIRTNFVDFDYFQRVK
ncbi:hypothetical protein GPJ56_002931 [Histomonas meleagridis]|uniref:uncharacterized protein n=1 Tax=Histomonas meleagridis TaxID=135588 RepID=UPI00355A5D63|nr:hypothetical protein GPJ56_002931 [Histomonas meleagridis]KAH0800369.1 hypothetical protein GO595_006780 [Histomonas meleagridis]